ncbi:hypothetical protein BPOR_0650g00030 [Botrytis porri]|uniref:Uncharacterized protein n=1 Tax=Botrytis porri TaxID=87229 RepID=A0A4Z1KIL1_9HELO|nr:hypothetical protein BPOR_0650g00030 [Botrytis porri]
MQHTVHVSPNKSKFDTINAIENREGQLDLLVIASDSSIPVDTMLSKKNSETRRSLVASDLSTPGLSKQNEILSLQVPGGISHPFDTFEIDSWLPALADLLPKIMNIYIHRLEYLLRRMAADMHSA